MTASNPSVLLIPTPPQAAQSSGLPRIDFADCYHGHAGRAGITAMEAARAMLDKPPAWSTALLAARDAIVGRLGLKTAQGISEAARGPRVGIFPVISEMPNELVLGLDDKHLDFRIWVSVQGMDGGSDVRVSTLVRLHGWPGRIYLGTIMPFHKLLSRVMLRRALKSLAS
jgi:hypothetical protein